MFSILAGLKRPTARFMVALGISVTLIGSSLQLPVTSADSAIRPHRVDVTQQITSAGDDVNEDGSGFDAGYGYIWLGTGANPSASYTGLRFANLVVPQGATITSAKLQVYLSSSSWSSLSFDYFAENSGNSAAFSTSNRPSQRTLTSQSVSHSSDVNWPATTWIDLDDISTVIQPVISRSDWASGNALSIILKGVGGAYGRKFVIAYDGAAAYAIRLAITYTTGGPTPTNTAVAPTGTPTATRTNTPVGPTATALGGGTQVSRQIVGTSDDVNEDGSGLEADYGTVWFGTGANASASYTGLRFTNITIPQGATITSAKLQVYLSNSSWSQLSFDYFAESTGNSTTFSDSSRPSQRALTSQSVSHSSDVNWPADTWIDLDEISSVVQPVVNRSDWNSGNALSIILKGVGGAYGRKFVTAYDGTPANAVRLAITFATSTATPTRTMTASATSTRTQTTTATRTATTTSTVTQSPLPTPSSTRTPTPLPTLTPNAAIGEGYPGPQNSPEAPASGPFRLLLAEIARGIPPKPTTSTSWYRIDVTRDSIDQGCSLANQRAPGTQAVILSFGNPWVTTRENENHVPVPAYGVQLYPDGFNKVYVEDVEYSVRNLVTGFVDCAAQIGLGPQSRIEVIVGLNHDVASSQVTYQHGAAWAQLIARIGDWLISTGNSGRASVAAGMDFEETFTAPYSEAKSWLDGYLSLAVRPLYNFGTCTGCAYSNFAAGFQNGWSENGIWSVSASGPYLRVIPEIYTTDPGDGTAVHAEQWAKLASWAQTCASPCLPAQTGNRGPMPYYGVLTQVQACNYTDTTPFDGDDCPDETRTSASTAWAQIHLALTKYEVYPRPLTIVYSTDIDWQRP